LKSSALILQKLKPRDVPAIEDQHLAIQQQRAEWELRNRFRDAGKGRRTILAVTGKQRYALAFFVCEDAIAIVFFFVDPAWAVERFTHQSRQHGMHAKLNSIAHRRRSDWKCRADNSALQPAF
jgi:hypothetical protein